MSYAHYQGDWLDLTDIRVPLARRLTVYYGLVSQGLPAGNTRSHSNQIIASMLGVTVGSLKNARTKLVEDGMIRKVQQGDKWGWVTVRNAPTNTQADAMRVLFPNALLIIPGKLGRVPIVWIKKTTWGLMCKDFRGRLFMSPESIFKSFETWCHTADNCMAYVDGSIRYQVMWNRMVRWLSGLKKEGDRLGWDNPGGALNAALKSGKLPPLDSTPDMDALASDEAYLDVNDIICGTRCHRSDDGGVTDPMTHRHRSDDGGVTDRHPIGNSPEAMPVMPDCVESDLAGDPYQEPVGLTADPYQGTCQVIDVEFDEGLTDEQRMQRDLEEALG